MAEILKVRVKPTVQKIVVRPDALPGAPGTPGREIELQKSATHIQWRYVGGSTWTDLVLLEDLRGEPGTGGGGGGAVAAADVSFSNIDAYYVYDATDVYQAIMALEGGINTVYSSLNQAINDELSARYTAIQQEIQDRNDAISAFTQLLNQETGGRQEVDAYLEGRFMPSITGTVAAPTAVSTQIAFTGLPWNQSWYIKGSGGPVVLSDTPKIAAATNPGQRLTIFTVDDVNTVTINSDANLILKSSFVGSAGRALLLESDTDLKWREIGRT